MKKGKVICYFLSCVGLSAATVDVFFLAGQSNASGRATTGYTYDSRDDQVAYHYYTDGGGTFDSDGFTTISPMTSGYYGSEVAIGRELISSGYNPAIIKVSKGGQSLAINGHWNTVSTSSTSTWQIWKSEVSSALSTILANGDTPILRAFFWNQGETDADNETYANAYEANFNQLVVDVFAELTDYGSDKMQFITALTHSTYGINTPLDYADTVRDAQQNIMNAQSNYHYFDTNDISDTGQYNESTNPDGMMGDHLHFNGAGLDEIGSRFVNTYLASVPEPSATSILFIASLCTIGTTRRRNN